VGTVGTVPTIAAAVVDFLESLDGDARVRATAPFDTPDHREWTYLPDERPGVRLSDLTVEQRELALALLDVGCSSSGALTARQIIELNKILQQLRKGGDEPPDNKFWVRVLGDPRGGAPWAFRVNGHHLAVHITVVDGELAVTPQFFGANPAVVPRGPFTGLRTLPDEEDLARNVLACLDARQLERAVVAADAPDDIATRHDPVADPSVVPAGLAWTALGARQQLTLQRLIRLYFDRAPASAADAAWSGAVDAGLDAVTFAWAGPLERGQGHYYAVRGPTFLLEYDNTQDGANHIHSVWRDLRGDWGEDLLRAHHAAHHH
jgi:hypothetical protein